MLAATRSPLSLLFLVLPVVMWAALRFQLLGAAPCVLVVSVFAVPAAVDRVGPFADHGLLAVMVQLQALNGVAALTGLLLAAVTTERENTLDTIEQACVALAEVVNRLAPGEADGPWPPPPTVGAPTDGRPPYERRASAVRPAPAVPASNTRSTRGPLPPSRRSTRTPGRDRWWSPAVADLRGRAVSRPRGRGDDHRPGTERAGGASRLPVVDFLR
ncbi:MASE1 domain-containing protein [Kitasatospora saccharophila]|uniref:MASE1 domain-containing protein n=1 Tax=Kitasatospora saccharophila TaxID=407973 RepID=UPI00363966B8